MCFFSRYFLIALLCFLSAGCATKDEMAAVKRDNEELKSRLLTIERDLRTEAKMSAEQARTSLLKEVDSVKNDVALTRKAAADLQAIQDASKNDMRILEGKIDDVSIAAKKPADDLNLLKEDMERRFASFEERLTLLDKNLAEQLAKAAAPIESKPPVPPPPEGVYQKGLDSYKKGEITTGREQLQDFLKNNPDHELAANAQYWIGETFFSEKNFEQAIIAFQEVIKKYPGKEKIPAALLKQGMAFGELGDKQSARFIYGTLKKDFPKSPEAKLAADKLKVMK